MKLYVFNGIERWNEDVSHAVFAESLEKAERRLREVKKPYKEYSVEEVEICDGLVLEAFGYDERRMSVYKPGGA